MFVAMPAAWVCLGQWQTACGSLLASDSGHLHFPLRLEEHA